jgi:DNA-binding IclR family transcriptional regulator
VSQSLERALDLLDKLANGPQRLGPLAEELQIHKSTVLRLLQTLERHGFVRRQGDVPEFTLGFRLVQLSQSVLEELDIRRVAELALRRLGQQTGETVHLAVLDGAEVMYIDKVESVHPVRMYSKVGARAPVHCTGVGKILLAYTDESRWPAMKMHRFTEQTITTRAAMVRAAREIREQGWGQDEREHEDSIRCIAAPVFGPNNDVVAAVSVSVPTSRLSREALNEHIGALLEATDAISTSLGARLSARTISSDAGAQPA